MCKCHVSTSVLFTLCSLAVGSPFIISHVKIRGSTRGSADPINLIKGLKIYFTKYFKGSNFVGPTLNPELF